ncbi:MAG: AI-2E family transporter [Sphaerobacter sp.]|nr:AI-2E family transporter [Sphaerobacter sp.]
MHPLDRLRETRLLPVFIGLALAALGLLLLRVAHILPPFVWAAVTAYLLHPLVVRLQRRLGVPRGVAIGSLFILIFGLLVVVGVRVVPTLYEQILSLIRALPSLIETARQELLRNPRISIGDVTIDTAAINAQIEELTKAFASRFSREAPSLVLQTVGFVIHLLVYLLATYYFLLQGDRAVGRLTLLLPPRHHETVERIISQVNAAFGAYIRTQLILFGIMSVATFIVLSVLQVQYALALGIATGALELIPIIGPWTAAGIAMTVALSQGTTPFGWTPLQLAAAVGLAYLVLRLLEDQFVIPQLVGRIVRIHPLMVIFGVLAGASIGGALGLILAVPVLAATKIIVLTVVEELRHPPARRVVALREPGELRTFAAQLKAYARQHVVLLIAEHAVTWDDLPDAQQLASDALRHDIRLEVVTPDQVAASIATAAGIEVITSARIHDEVEVRVEEPGPAVPVTSGRVTDERPRPAGPAH